MAYAGAILMILGTVVQAYGYTQQGDAALAAAKYNARVANLNAQAARTAADYQARIAENQGIVARQAAEVRAEDVRRRGERVQATGAVLTAASGIDYGEGSPLLVAMDNAREIEIAARRELYSGAVQEQAAQQAAGAARYTGNVRALGYESEARLQMYTGKVARQQAYTKAGSTLLTGIGSAGTAAGWFGPSSPSSGANIPV